MGGAFELVRFLSRSDHRVTTLRTLAKRSYSRLELQQETNIPRASLARILADMERENLVIHREGTYSITPLGDVLVSGVQSILEELEPLQTPPELVMFLTRAENRIAVLMTLTSGPYDRRGLQETTGIPRATLNRILADLRDLGIVTRIDGEYVATRLGEIIASELRSLFDMLETVEILSTIEQWLPTDSADFDLTTLAASNVTIPTPSDPLAPIERAFEAVLEADGFWAVSRSATPDTLEASRRAVFDGRGVCEVVISSDIFDVIAVDPTIEAKLREIDDTDHIGLFVHEGKVRHNLAVVDGTVLLRVHDGEEAIKALVATRDDAVRSWADTIREMYVSDAERIDILELERDHAVEPAIGPDREDHRSEEETDEMVLIRRVYEEAWGGDWNLDLIDEYVGDEFVRHVPYRSDIHSAEEYKEHIAAYRDAFPDAEGAVEEIVARGDRYFFRWRAWGTQVGGYADIKPSGERIKFSGVTMARFADGRCVEEWSFSGFPNLVD